MEVTLTAAAETMGSSTSGLRRIEPGGELVAGLARQSGTFSLKLDLCVTCCPAATLLPAGLPGRRRFRDRRTRGDELYRNARGRVGVRPTGRRGGEERGREAKEGEERKPSWTRIKIEAENEDRIRGLALLRFRGGKKATETPLRFVGWHELSMWSPRGGSAVG